MAPETKKEEPKAEEKKDEKKKDDKKKKEEDDDALSEEDEALKVRPRLLSPKARFRKVAHALPRAPLMLRPRWSCSSRASPTRSPRCASSRSSRWSTRSARRRHR